jgi:tRNA threonylcarbamoyladenosine biosynthesis protein TsaE
MGPFEREVVILELTSHSPHDTQEIGHILGQLTQGGDLFLLTGGLGVGKTCFTQGLAVGMGVPDNVRSPTFVLICEYEGRLKLYHMDLYRLDNPMEVLELGLEEYLESDGVCVVEWAEKTPSVFPRECLHIQLKPLDETIRMIQIEAHGIHYQEILQDFIHIYDQEKA